MRKFFMWLGIGTAALIVLAVAGMVFLAIRGSELDGESRVYAAESIAAIVPAWSHEELLRRATPQLKAAAKPFEVAALFNAFSAGLGKLLENELPVGSAIVSVTAGEGKVIAANYVVKARFEKGDAVIRVSLLKQDDQWRVQGFYIDSPAAITNLSGRPS
jgi:hypothetical protein